MFTRSVRATHLERTRPLPGDELIPNRIASLTHAITIHRPPCDVWPWLVQMGLGRAGWYSYDRIDNNGRPSADRIVPDLQRITVGTIFPAVPGSSEGFVVVRFETNRFLVLAWPAKDGGYVTTWCFVIEETRPGETRLVVRVSGSAAYPFFGLPAWLGKPVVRLVHFVMERKQLLRLRTRIERWDALADRFMPVYDVVERHSVRVSAPAALTLETATAMDLQQSAAVRAIFKAREWIMRSRPPMQELPRAFMAQMRAIGWGTLAEIPGHEIVMGAVTEPWQADVVFRPLPPDAFAAFDEPGHAKILWTLRADPIGPDQTCFRTETRVATTDATARARFRRYWFFVSPGIILIRLLLLPLVKRAAEHHFGAHEGDSHVAPIQP